MGVCLVTGSSRGFGRLISIRLAQEGHHVFATMRDPSTADNDLAACCTPVRLDVADDASVAQAVQTVIQSKGRIDVVVNNAGYALWGPVEETPVEQVARQFDVNVFGGLRVLRAVLPTMRQQRSGVVVQISSISGRVVAGPFWGHYAASKFALEALSEALAYEVRPFGIRVVLIEPGSYATTMGESIELSASLTNSTTAYEAAYRTMENVGEPWPLGDPEDIADAVVTSVAEPTTPLRVPLGEDAAWYLDAKAQGDEEYRRRIWGLWQLPAE
jgi:NAD(P)-dependent dehydrogenase (short-subunit alcohol dehydrogenase family)